MEENNNNELEMNTNMNQSSTTDNKQKKLKVIPVLSLIIVILILLLVLCVGNMYAITNDYDNVFTMVGSIISRQKNNVVNEEKEIKKELTPSGFTGSSLIRVVLYSDNTVYVVKYNGAGYEESNIVDRILIAKNVDTIEYNGQGQEFKSILVKGEKLEIIENSYNWIEFNPETTVTLEIKKELTPSGFSGSSLIKVVLYSDNTVYVVKYDGTGHEESNIVDRILIAKNVDTIEYNGQGQEFKSILVKGEELEIIENSYNWIEFDPEIAITLESKTKDFVSENPKISFQYPNDWTIETNSWNIWNRTVKAPEDGITIIIKKEENKDNKQLKDLISLDWGSNVLDEGVLNIKNYKAYYKTYTFADAQYSVKAKDVMIDTGKGEYYSISFVVGGENMNMSNEQAFEKYEPVLSNLVSSVKF